MSTALAIGFTKINQLLEWFGIEEPLDVANCIITLDCRQCTTIELQRFAKSVDAETVRKGWRVHGADLLPVEHYQVLVNGDYFLCDKCDVVTHNNFEPRKA